MTVANVETSDDQNSYIDISENRDRSVLKKVLRHGYCDVRPDSHDFTYVQIFFSSFYLGGDLDGQPFKLRTKPERPLEFALKNGDTYGIFLLSVPTMELGEICELIVAPNGLYENSPRLRFEVELLCITSDMSESRYLTNDASLRITKRMPWIRGATVGYSATMKYRSVNSDKPNDFRELTYIVGDYKSSGVPMCVDLAIQNLREGEWGIINEKITRPNHIYMSDPVWYGENVYEVTLIKGEYFDPDLLCLCSCEKERAVAESFKSRANEHLKNGRYSVAITMYQRLVNDLTRLGYMVGKQDVHEKIKTAALLNQALAHLKNNESSDCIDCCQEVLDIDASNEKALYRMGQAYLLQDNLEKARDFFNHVLQLNPRNTEAARAMEKYMDYNEDQDLKTKTRLRRAVDIFKQTGFGSEHDFDYSDHFVT